MGVEYEKCCAILQIPTRLFYFVSTKELFGNTKILDIVIFYFSVRVRIKQRKHLDQHMWYMKIYIDILGLLKYHTFITYFKTAP